MTTATARSAKPADDRKAQRPETPDTANDLSDLSAAGRDGSSRAHTRPRALDRTLLSASVAVSASTDPPTDTIRGKVVDLPLADRRRAALKTAFLKALRGGLTVSAACVGLKIGRSTVHDWKRDDAAFAEQWDSALIEGVEFIENLILEHGQKDWRALCAYLAANRPEKWHSRRCGSCAARELREREAAEDKRRAERTLPDVIDAQSLSLISETLERARDRS